MIRSYGVAYINEFPNPDTVLHELNDEDVAVIMDKRTEYNFVLTKGLFYWTQVTDLVSEVVKRSIENDEQQSLNMYPDILSHMPTYVLVEELEKRHGVKTVRVEPYKDETVSVNGPAIILVVTD